MSTIGAQRIHEHTLSYPAFGSWRLDATLEGGDVPTGKVVATIVDLELHGTVLPRSGEDAPDRPRLVVVGAPGWERRVAKPLSYGDAPVRLSTVLRDLAKRADETVELPADREIGTSFAGVASREGEVITLRSYLSALHGAGYVGRWRVDPDGVTRFGPRPATTTTERATVMRRNRSVGLTVVGLDSPNAFLPGTLFEGSPILRLDVHERPDKLTADLYTTQPSTMTSILRKVAEVFPALVYGHPRTYVVQNVRSDGRLDLSPPIDAPHLPEISGAEQWTLGGAQAWPVVGSSVVVLFRDANPTRAIVVACAPLSGGAFATKPTRVTVDATSDVFVGPHAGQVVTGAPTTPQRYAREGDTYSIGTATGPLTFVSTTQLSGPTTGKG